MQRRMCRPFIIMAFYLEILTCKLSDRLIKTAVQDVFLSAVCLVFPTSMYICGKKHSSKKNSTFLFFQRMKQISAKEFQEAILKKGRSRCITFGFDESTNYTIKKLEAIQKWKQPIFESIVSFLKQFENKTCDVYKFMVLLGPAGQGKTTLAATSIRVPYIHHHMIDWTHYSFKRYSGIIFVDCALCDAEWTKLLPVLQGSSKICAVNVTSNVKIKKNIQNPSMPCFIVFTDPLLITRFEAFLSRHNEECVVYSYNEQLWE